MRGFITSGPKKGRSRSLLQSGGKIPEPEAPNVAHSPSQAQPPVGQRRRDAALFVFIAPIFFVAALASFFLYGAAPSPAKSLYLPVPSFGDHTWAVAILALVFVIAVLTKSLKLWVRILSILLVTIVLVVAVVVSETVMPSSYDQVQNWANTRYSLHLTEDQAGDLVEMKTVNTDSGEALRLFEANPNHYIIVDTSRAENAELPSQPLILRETEPGLYIFESASQSGATSLSKEKS